MDGNQDDMTSARNRSGECGRSSYAPERLQLRTVRASVGGPSWRASGREQPHLTMLDVHRKSEQERQQCSYANKHCNRHQRGVSERCEAADGVKLGKNGQVSKKQWCVEYLARRAKYRGSFVGCTAFVGRLGKI